MSQQHLPNVFVFSTSEDHEYARAVQQELQLDSLCKVTLWTQAPQLSEGTIKWVSDSLSKSDFAVLILTAVDRVESRGIQGSAPRDNLLFELGLSVGILGLPRSFAIVEDDQQLKLPTEFDGISYAKFAKSNDHGEYRQPVSAACTDIRNAIRRLGHRKVNAIEIIPENEVYSRSVTHLQRQLGGKILILMSADEPVDPEWIDALKQWLRQNPGGKRRQLTRVILVNPDSSSAIVQNAANVLLEPFSGIPLVDQFMMPDSLTVSVVTLCGKLTFQGFPMAKKVRPDDPNPFTVVQAIHDENVTGELEAWLETRYIHREPQPLKVMESGQILRDNLNQFSSRFRDAAVE